jgi:hypothetical protein
VLADFFGLGRLARMTRLKILFLAVVCCACVQAQEATNVPPPSSIFIDGNGSRNFLGFTNVYLTRRAETNVSLRFHFGADHDEEGELLYFYWYDGETVVSEQSQYTNTYAHGLHTLRVALSDNREVVHVTVPLEIISPLDAIRRLRADLELTGVRENIAALRPLLRVAERAIERRDWRSAYRRLERFDERLSEDIDANTDQGAALVERWSRAARVIGTSVRPQRSGPLKPPIGPFPGPG